MQRNAARCTSQVLLQHGRPPTPCYTLTVERLHNEDSPMSLTTMQRAKQAATTRVQNLSLLVQDKDKAMRSMRATVKDLQLEKRVGRASHTIGSVLGGAGAGAAEAFMESTGTETELDVMGVSVPLVGIGAIAVRVAAETMDPSAEGTGMLTSVADGALAYSAGSIAKKLVSSWAM